MTIAGTVVMRRSSMILGFVRAINAPTRERVGTSIRVCGAASAVTLRTVPISRRKE
jgi:hypothetical protein